MTSLTQNFPTLQEITNAQIKLAPFIQKTPVNRWIDDAWSQQLGSNTEVYVKQELLQVTGTFKHRGSLNVMLSMSQEELNRGVVAVSAGNHAIAIAYSAKVMGTTAKVVMTKNANPLSMQKARELGAEIVLVDDRHQAFDLVETIEQQEGRTYIHPFEGPLTLQGTGTVGLEITQQTPQLDVMILPIGGGGLCSGIAAALKQVWPDIIIYGVEPSGANAMYQSFQQNKPVSLDKVSTIADSLAPPKCESYFYGVCHKFVDDIVMVTDDELKAAMVKLFDDMKLAVEPAAAATTAALFGPLKDRVQGKKVGIICCGASISIDNFTALISPTSTQAD